MSLIIVYDYIFFLVSLQNHTPLILVNQTVKSVPLFSCILWSIQKQKLYLYLETFMFLYVMNQLKIYGFIRQCNGMIVLYKSKVQPYLIISNAFEIHIHFYNS